MPSLRSRIFKSVILRQRAILRQGRTIQEERAEIEALAKKWIRPPRAVSVLPVTAGGVPAEWVEARKSETQRVILYLHGGGYTICSPATHRGLTGQLALACRARLLVIDYRLAPEHPFPAALEDALSAYRWLLDQGIRPQQIAVGGDSAGGGLTLAAAVSLRAAGEPLPAALFLISPWTDLTFSGESHQTRAKVDPIFRGGGGSTFAPAYADGHDPSDPLISPVFADLHHLPPTLIHVGNDEILLSDSTRLAEKLRTAGGEVTLEIWPGMWHVFPTAAPWIPESVQSIHKIAAFIGEHIPGKPPVETTIKRE